MPLDTPTHVSRRSFLKAGLAAGVGSLGVGARAIAAPENDKPYGPFKMGLQSYSLRKFPLPTALSQMQQLGLEYLEGFPQHIPVGTVPSYVRKQKDLLDKHGITLSAYGVLNFNENETKAREYFDFAHAMGIPVLSANPGKNKATFDLLDQLVAEYDVKIAIHNHGPGADYDKIDDVVEWVKDRHPNIGACVDTGHYLRSNEDPVKALEQLSDRLYGVHLKDVKSFDNPQAAEEFVTQHQSHLRITEGTKVMCILGEGDLDLPGCLRVLQKIKFPYCMSLEYEENEENPLPDIQLCLEKVQSCLKDET